MPHISAADKDQQAGYDVQAALAGGVGDEEVWVDPGGYMQIGGVSG
jgi:hypothetical protein